MKVEPIKDIDTIRDIMNYLKSDNERDYVMFTTGIYTGLRISDILRLRVCDVRDRKVLRVKQKKTGEVVEIPVNAKLKKIYKDYCKDKDEMDYLIANERMGVSIPIKRDRAYKIMNKVAKIYRLDRIGTHTLRKTCGYHMYKNNGNNIGLVMKVLGQKNSASTLNYIGLNDLDVKKGIDSLNF
jgi:integrase